jgi:hypothetical protein
VRYHFAARVKNFFSIGGAFCAYIVGEIFGAKDQGIQARVCTADVFDVHQPSGAFDLRYEPDAQLF